MPILISPIAEANCELDGRFLTLEALPGLAIIYSPSESSSSIAIFALLSSSGVLITIIELGSLISGKLLNPSLVNLAMHS